MLVHPVRELAFFALSLLGKKKYFREYRYSKKELKRFLEQSGFSVIYTCIDDYEDSEKGRHIGLYADFFFLRKRRAGIWELNAMGRFIRACGILISPWFYCSALMMVAKKSKELIRLKQEI